MLAQRVAEQHARIPALTEALRTWDQIIDPPLSNTVDLADLAAYLAGRTYTTADILPIGEQSSLQIIDYATDLGTHGTTAFLTGLAAVDPDARALIVEARTMPSDYEKFLAGARLPDDDDLAYAWDQLGRPSGDEAILRGLMTTSDPPTEADLNEARLVVREAPLETLLEGVGLTPGVARIVRERYASRDPLVPAYLTAAGVTPADLTASGLVGDWVDSLWQVWQEDGMPEDDEGFWLGLRHI